MSNGRVPHARQKSRSPRCLLHSWRRSERMGKNVSVRATHRAQGHPGAGGMLLLLQCRSGGRKAGGRWCRRKVQMDSGPREKGNTSRNECAMPYPPKAAAVAAHPWKSRKCWQEWDPVWRTRPQHRRHPWTWMIVATRTSKALRCRSCR